MATWLAGTGAAEAVEGGGGKRRIGEDGTSKVVPPMATSPFVFPGITGVPDLTGGNGGKGTRKNRGPSGAKRAPEPKKPCTGLVTYQAIGGHMGP